MSLQRFTITPADCPVTLSACVAEKLRISGSKAKKLLDAKSVWVNGKRIWMARHALRPGDQVEVRVPRAATPSRPRATVLLETSELLAVDKPAGWVSDRHPRSLESFLRKETSTPGLRALHRLDRDTSGVLLFIKEPRVRAGYVELFQQHLVEKQYDVLLAGNLPQHRMEVTRAIDGKSASSIFHRKSESKGYCRAECHIVTGRTHQIRRHALVLGCRVLGEHHYRGGPDLREMEKTVPRHMLHAASVRFPHPETGDSIHIHAPWPDDFKRVAHQFHVLS